MSNKKEKGFLSALVITAAIMGAYALIGFLVERAIEPTLTEQVITSKTVEEIGTRCFRMLGFINCSKKYAYYINGYNVGEKTFNSVQEGETYLCTSNFVYCKELKDE